MKTIKVKNKVIFFEKLRFEIFYNNFIAKIIKI